MNTRRKSKPLYSMRRTPTQARSKAMIGAILTAATELLLEVGYDKASTNRIASRAGVSIGSLYDYFPGKEAVFAEVQRREDRRLFDMTRINLETPETVNDWLRQQVAMYLNYVRSNLALYATLLREVPRHVLNRDELFVFRYYVPWMSDYLKSHQEQLYPMDSATEVTKFLASVVLGTVDEHILHSPERLSDSGFEDMLVNLLKRFLLKPESGF